MPPISEANTPSELERDKLGLPTAFESPASQAETKIAEIWRDALNIDRIGRHDDFFDLGGDSLNAVTISSAVSDAFNIAFKPSMMMEVRTIAQMAGQIGETPGPDLPGNVTALQAAGDLPPLFVVHGQHGIGFFRPGFMTGFRKNQPIYAFQVPGFDGAEEPYETVDEIAETYLRTILAVQPEGPHFIAAFCAGSWIAMAIANKMREKGLEPDRLIFLDPPVLELQKADYYVARNPLTGGGIPIVSRAAAGLVRLAMGIGHRLNMLARTGHPVSGRDRKSFMLPKVQQYWLDRQRFVLLAHEPDRTDVADDGRAGQSAGQNEPIRQAPPALRASTLLQLAFRTHRPRPFDGKVHLVASRKLAADMQNPAHPFNGMMPNRDEIIFGKDHIEAVAGNNPRNARLIQEIIDTVPPRRG